MSFLFSALKRRTCAIVRITLHDRCHERFTLWNSINLNFFQTLGVSQMSFPHRCEVDNISNSCSPNSSLSISVGTERIGIVKPTWAEDSVKCETLCVLLMNFNPYSISVSCADSVWLIIKFSWDSQSYRRYNSFSTILSQLTHGSSCGDTWRISYFLRR